MSAYGKQGAWSLKLSNSFAFALAGPLDLRKLGFQPERLIFHVASTRAWILFFARWRVPPPGPSLPSSDAEVLSKVPAAARSSLLRNGACHLTALAVTSVTHKVSSPGVEPGLLRPQRDVLTTRR